MHAGGARTHRQRSEETRELNNRQDDPRARPGAGRARQQAHPRLPGRRARRRHDPAAARLGEAVLPDVLHPRDGRPHRAALSRRHRRSLAQQGRRPPVHGQGRRQGSRRRRPPLRALAVRGAARCDPARLERDGRLVRGGRAGVHPPARSLHTRRHPPQLAPCPSRARRRDDRRDDQADPPVRDRTSRSVLPAQDARAHGPADTDRERQSLPVQGRRRVLVGPGRGKVHATWRGRTGRRFPRVRRSPG